MSQTTERADFAALLRPVDELRGRLVARRDELVAELAEVREQLAEIDRVLKAANLMEREPRKPQRGKQTNQTSPRLSERVLEFVNSQPEVISRQVADTLGVSLSSAGKALSELRANDKIRLLRVEPSNANGKGRRPVYAPWTGTK